MNNYRIWIRTPEQEYEFVVNDVPNLDAAYGVVVWWKGIVT
ncbi:hypothetical protein EVC29_091 [Rhizobium phage RHph_Y52]|nr:hypothetical protein EVC16_091 [Rhizobium phage RHph_Y21]QIG76792.1 hypothetical protein EVC29_091 [Rhizobium phage RHph_Y52]